MEYSFDINSETEKFELYYLKCICAGRAHEGFYIVYPSKCKGSYQKDYLSDKFIWCKVRSLRITETSEGRQTD